MRGYSKHAVILSLPSRPEYISIARMSVATMGNLAHMNIDEIEDLKVAISEACTNALRYGCTKDDHYEVAMDLRDGGLSIEVTDTGEGFDVDRIKAPRLGEQVGGYGIFLIQSLMDDMRIDSVLGEGTSVKLFKRPELYNGINEPAFEGRG